MARHNDPYDPATCLLIIHVPIGLIPSPLLTELRPAFILEDPGQGKFFVTLTSVLEVAEGFAKILVLINAGSTFKMAEPGYYKVGNKGLHIHNDCAYEFGTLIFTPDPD